MVDVAGITCRPMFGGYCLYKDGVAFGMIANDTLYFKVGDSNHSDYEKLGSSPFTYSNRGKVYAMSYWEVPQEVMDNPDMLKKWILKSQGVKLKK